MADQPSQISTEIIDLNALEKAHELATREAQLEHARAGRSVSEWRDGREVKVPPAEIFARYGLDANGNPKPAGGKP